MQTSDREETDNPFQDDDDGRYEADQQVMFRGSCSRRRAKSHFVKNLVFISFSLLLNATASGGRHQLQAAFHSDDILDIITNSVYLGSVAIGCLFFAPPIIACLGCKWAIVVSFVPYLVRIVADVYPMRYVIIAMSGVTGLWASVLWSATCSYITEIGVEYSRWTASHKNTHITRFFGIFFTMVQISRVATSLIASFLLHPKSADIAQRGDSCGAFHCLANTSFVPAPAPSSLTAFTLFGVYLGLVLLATVLTAVFLNKLPAKEETDVRQSSRCSGRLELFVATIQLWGQKQLLFLIPITIYTGMQHGFMVTDFLQAYISCSLGTWSVAVTLLVHGLVASVTSLISSRLSSLTGRSPVLAAGALVQCVTLVTLFLWYPNASRPYVFYILAGLWGMGDAVWRTMLSAIYGCFFTSNNVAAFANYHMWQNVGLIVAFAYGDFLCVYSKILALLATLVLGIFGYYVTEAAQHGKNASR